MEATASTTYVAATSTTSVATAALRKRKCRNYGKNKDEPQDSHREPSCLKLTAKAAYLQGRRGP
jgi:hypothetical protein